MASNFGLCDVSGAQRIDPSCWCKSLVARSIPRTCADCPFGPGPSGFRPSGAWEWESLGRPLSSLAPSSPWPPPLPWAAGLGRSSLCLEGGLPDLELTCFTFHFPLQSFQACARPNMSLHLNFARFAFTDRTPAVFNWPVFPICIPVLLSSTLFPQRWQRLFLMYYLNLCIITWIDQTYGSQVCSGTLGM